MKRLFGYLLIVIVLGLGHGAYGESEQRVIDVSTRPGVTQRFLYLSPKHPHAAVILFAGGQGGLDISPDGELKRLKGNFLVRTRLQFEEGGLSVAVVDAPSDRQRAPFLDGFRQTREHVTDIKAVIAWLRKQNNIPVWLIGTSRGTQSAAFIATEIGAKEGGPDGLVLTSTILNDNKGRSVLEMPLGKIMIPVLVIHHKDDWCKLCSYDDIPKLMNKLSGATRKELITITGGKTSGDPCEAMAHHGFNGQDKEVVGKIIEWIRAN